MVRAICTRSTFIKGNPVAVGDRIEVTPEIFALLKAYNSARLATADELKGSTVQPQQIVKDNRNNGNNPNTQRRT